MYRHLAGCFFAFSLALTLVPSANAGVKHWNTNVDGALWNVAGNWLPVGVPTATDTAVIDFAGTYSVNMNVNPTIAALRISGSTSGVQTVSGSARTFSLPNASSIGAQGVLILTGSNTISGAGAITNEGTVQIAAGSIAQTFTNLGTLQTGPGSLALNGTFSNATGAMLRVQSTASTATLTILNGFTNNGAIELTNSAGSGAAVLNVTNGTLVNAASATISALTGIGGSRQLNAELNNAGTITIGANTSTNVASADHVNTGTIDVTGGNYTVTLSTTTPSFTMTSGAINVASGRTLFLNGAVAPGTNQVYQYNGGTLGGAGSISMTNATLALGIGIATSTTRLTNLDDCTVNGPGTLTVSTGTTLNPLFSSTGSTINAPVVVQSGGTLTLTSSDQLGTLDNSGTVNATGTSTMSGLITTQPGSVLRVYGGTLTVNNSFTNTAAIELTAVNINTTATLSMASTVTLTNAASGTITALAGAGGGNRNLNVEYHNAGTITVAGQNLFTNVASADHVNTGTIDVTGGNYTVTLSTTTPSFTMTSGAINVASGRTLNLNGAVAPGTNQVYQYNGGTLGGAGTISMLNATLALGTGIATSSAHLAFDDCTVNGPGTLTVSTGTTLNAGITTTGTTINAPVVVESGGTLTLTSSDMLGALDNSGTFNVTGASSSSGLITTQLGSSIRVYGGTFTVNGSFTNSAAIELTSQAVNTSAVLSMPTGTLTNASTGTITTVLGPGGGNRQLNAEYNNVGTISVSGTNLITSVANADHVNSGTIDVTGGNYTLTLSGSTPTFLNTGTINVASGRTMSLNGPAATTNSLYTHSGGSIGGAGTVSLNNATLTLNVAMNTSATHLDPASCIINGPATLTVSTGTTLTATSSVLNCPVVVQSGATLDLFSTAMNGNITNGGTWLVRGTCPVGSANITTDPNSVIRIQADGNTAWMQVSTGFTNDSAIELTSLNNSGTARLDVSSGTLVNTTYATISALVGAGGARQLNANLTNVGTVTVGAAMTTVMTSMNQLNTGIINLTTGNWTFTMSGTTGSFTNTGTLSIPVGRTLALNGTNVVNRGAGLNYNINNGSTISGGGILSARHSTLKFNIPYSASFADVSGDSATFFGPDTLYITAGDSVHAVGSLFSGPVVVNAGGKMSINLCDLAGTVHNAGLVEVINLCTSSGVFASLGGSSIIMPGISTANSRFRFSNGFTNNSVLDMTSRAVAGASILETLAGTITNSATGTINVEASVGGARQILGPFSNAGQLNVHLNLSLIEAGAAHLNSGTISIDATRTMTVTGATLTNLPSGTIQGSGTLSLSLTGGALNQQGKIAPGASPGSLSIIRAGAATIALPFAATSSLDVEVGGDVVGTGYDRLIADGPVTLNGSLNISVINGYVPQPGLRYIIATFPSRTGTFSNITGLDYNVGKMWAVVVSDTNVVLLAMDQTWSRALPDGAPPAARDGHAAAYDPAGDRMMVFGGQTDASVQNDTWVLSKAVGFNYPAWAQLTTGGAAPSQRRDATAVYAAASNRLIVFGGADGSGATFGDVRVLTNANGVGGSPTWSALSPTGTPPSARSGHAAAYDAANDRMIVMGGDTTPNSCGGELSDVWVLSNASGASGTPAWTQLSPTGTPPSVRSHHGASYDAATGRLIVTGGDACSVANTETWTLSNANGIGPAPAWTLLTPAQPPPANWSLARYAYDESYGWLDAFGGKVGATLVDTAFTLTNAQGSGSPNWYRRLFYGDRPAPRSFHSMVMSSATHTAVVFGGMTASGRVNDVWRRMLDKGPVLDVEPPVVVPMHTAFALPPSPNPAHGAVSMAVDVARDQRVDLAVFDLAGRRVETIHSGPLPVGRHRFEWAAPRAGRAAPGVYMIRMKAEDKTQIVRVVQL